RVARLVVVRLPAVRVVRSTDAPTAAAMQEIHGPAFVQMSMSPFADYYLASIPHNVVLKESELRLEPAGTPYVCESVRPGRVFARPRDVLWNIVRHRY